MVASNAYKLVRLIMYSTVILLFLMLSSAFAQVGAPDRTKTYTYEGVLVVKSGKILQFGDADSHFSEIPEGRYPIILQASVSQSIYDGTADHHFLSFTLNGDLGNVYTFFDCPENGWYDLDKCPWSKEVVKVDSTGVTVSYGRNSKNPQREMQIFGKLSLNSSVNEVVDGYEACEGSTSEILCTTRGQIRSCGPKQTSFRGVMTVMSEVKTIRTNGSLTFRDGSNESVADAYFNAVKTEALGTQKHGNCLPQKH